MNDYDCMPEKIIHLWTPEPETHPEQYAVMRQLAEILPYLEDVFKAQGLTRADIMPPQRHGTYNPAISSPMLEYEIFPNIASELTSKQRHELTCAIDDKMDLFGTVRGPLEQHELRELVEKNKLKAMPLV